MDIAAESGFEQNPFESLVNPQDRSSGGAPSWHFGIGNVANASTPLPQKPSYGKFAFNLQVGDVLFEELGAFGGSNNAFDGHIAIIENAKFKPVVRNFGDGTCNGDISLALYDFAVF